jgi:hypothetical protein
MPVVHSVKVVQLSDAEINTVSKQTKATFDLTHVTYEFHRVPLKRFLWLLHVQRKMCTYLLLRLALSQKRPKQASI